MTIPAALKILNEMILLNDSYFDGKNKLNYIYSCWQRNLSFLFVRELILISKTSKTNI